MDVFSKIKDELNVVKSSYDDIAKRNQNLKHPSKNPKYPIFWLRYRLFGYKRIIDDTMGTTLFGKTKSLLAKFIK